MDKKPKRSWQDWGDIIFHKGSYVALAISLIFTVPVVICFIFLLFQMFGAHALLVLLIIIAFISYVAISIKLLI